MGWTGYNRTPGESDRDHLQAELLGEKYEIGDCATVRNVFYALCVPTDAGTAAGCEPFALVVLQRRDNRNNKRHGGFAFNPGNTNYWRKEMSEASGPGDAACPRSVLDAIEAAIPVPPNDWAAEWRARCWERIVRHEAASAVKPGMTVRFPRALTFSDGTTWDTFTFERRSSFRTSVTGVRVRISNWRDREFEVVGEPAGAVA